MPDAAAASSSQDVGSAWVGTPSWTAGKPYPHRTSPDGNPSEACWSADGEEHSAVKPTILVM